MFDHSTQDRSVKQFSMDSMSGGSQAASMGRTMMPPPFQLKADPVQKQENKNSSEGGGKEKEDRSSQSHIQDALKLVDQFEQSADSPTAFPNVPKAKFVGQLRKRLQDQTGTDQGQTWLCGPSAATHLFLMYDPVGYTKMAIELFSNGQSQLNGDTKAVSSTGPMEQTGVDRQGMVSDGSGNAHDISMDFIDYMMVGSIRATENNEFFKEQENYDPKTGSSLDSGTLPWEMKTILQRYLGFKVIQSAFYTGENLKAIQSNVAAGNPVILLIDTRGLQGKGEKKDGSKNQGKYGIIGKHYVVIDKNQSFTLNDNTISFSYWDYGGQKNKMNVSTQRFRTAVKGYWIVDKEK